MITLSRNIDDVYLLSFSMIVGTLIVGAAPLNSQILNMHVSRP